MTPGDEGAAAAARYAGAVRSALSDLPERAREDLLDDLESHLLEVVAEDGAPLEQRLGTPQAYAAELRASAGVTTVFAAPATRPGPLRRFDDRLRDEAERLGARAVAHPYGRAVADFLPELRPGWWVLRGWLAAWVLSFPLGGADLSAFPVPTLLGSSLLGLIFTLGCVLLSVRIGRGSVPARYRDPRWVLAADLVLVVLGLALAVNAQQRLTLVSSYVGSSAPQAPGVLMSADGRPISNLLPFDEQGRPLSGVQLYDQDGRPVDTLALAAPDGRYAEPEYRLDENGAQRGNVFPRSLTAEVWTDDGPSPAPVLPPAIAPARLLPEAGASPSPSPSPSPDPSPSPSPGPNAGPGPAAGPSPAVGATPSGSPSPPPPVTGGTPSGGMVVPSPVAPAPPVP